MRHSHAVPNRHLPYNSPVTKVNFPRTCITSQSSTKSCRELVSLRRPFPWLYTVARHVKDWQNALRLLFLKEAVSLISCQNVLPLPILSEAC